MMGEPDMRATVVGELECTRWYQKNEAAGPERSATTIAAARPTSGGRDL